MSQSNSPDGRTQKTRQTFRLEYAIRQQIQAPAERLWSLLTNAADLPRWNSTVTSVEGKIALGEKIKLKVPLAPGRTFNLKVSEFVPSQRMVVRDGMAPMFTGVRTYTLSPGPGGSTVFSMQEVLSGIMLPMIAGSLPDFAPAFEQYAADLKKEAERSAAS
jgi:uncharacterized protein YndB with AHSA1/START domain